MGNEARFSLDEKAKVLDQAAQLYRALDGVFEDTGEVTQALIEIEEVRARVKGAVENWAIDRVREGLGHGPPCRLGFSIWRQKDAPEPVHSHEKDGGTPHVRSEHFRARSITSNIVLVRIYADPKKSAEQGATHVLFVRYANETTICWDIYGREKNQPETFISYFCGGETKSWFPPHEMANQIRKVVEDHQRTLDITS